MGVEYSIACKECKVTRDLDKMYEAYTIDTRKEALDLSEIISKNPFRSALLASFMAEHMGHDCVFFCENHKDEEKYCPFFNEEYKEDLNYWSTDVDTSNE